LGFGPLEALLKDPTISDIMVNGPHMVYIERRGQDRKVGRQVPRTTITFMQIIDRIVSKVGRRVDETSPMVDARLPDGSRRQRHQFRRWPSMARRCRFAASGRRR